MGFGLRHVLVVRLNNCLGSNFMYVGKPSTKNMFSLRFLNLKTVLDIIQDGLSQDSRTIKL